MERWLPDLPPPWRAIHSMTSPLPRSGIVRANAPVSRRRFNALTQAHAETKEAANPFRYFNSSPEVIRLVVMMYVRYPLSLRNVEDLPFERGIDINHETVRVGAR